MKKWLRQRLPNKATIDNLPSHGWKSYFKDPSLWHYHCHSVAGGAGIGLFTSMIPILPFQTILGLVLAVLFRANLVVAIAVGWVNNPLTFVPINYFIYSVGEHILGKPSMHVIIQQYIWKWYNPHDWWTSSLLWVQQFGKAYLVGLPVVSITAAVGGYALVTIACRLRLFLRQRAAK